MPQTRQTTEVEAIKWEIEKLIDDESDAVGKYDRLLARANHSGLRRLGDSLFRIKEDERRHYDKLRRELKDLEKGK